jgi:hypothetical protein
MINEFFGERKTISQAEAVQLVEQLFQKGNELRVQGFERDFASRNASYAD